MCPSEIRIVIGRICYLSPLCYQLCVPFWIIAGERESEGRETAKQNLFTSKQNNTHSSSLACFARSPASDRAKEKKRGRRASKNTKVADDCGGGAEKEEEDERRK